MESNKKLNWQNCHVCSQPFNDDEKYLERASVDIGIQRVHKKCKNKMSCIRCGFWKHYYSEEFCRKCIAKMCCKQCEHFKNSVEDPFCEDCMKNK